MSTYFVFTSTIGFLHQVMWTHFVFTQFVFREAIRDHSFLPQITDDLGVGGRGNGSMSVIHAFKLTRAGVCLAPLCVASPA